MISRKILLRQVVIQTQSISGLTALLHYYHHTHFLVLVLSLRTHACCVYNSNVVWFPLCCKGPKSPALPRPDSAGGECHKAWRNPPLMYPWRQRIVTQLCRFVFFPMKAHLCVKFPCTCWGWDYPCQPTIILCYVFMPWHKLSLSQGGG